MRTPLAPETPLTILVTDGRWDAFDEPSLRNTLLVEVLTQIGGVSDTVAPGTYLFNVKDVDGKFVATLDPA